MTDSKLPLFPRRMFIALCGVSAVAWLGLGGAARAQATDSKAGATGNPTAESVLRRAGDFYKKARSFAVEAERAQRVGPLAMTNKLTIALARPNKLVCRTEGAMPGIDVVSDGKKLFVSVGVLKKYTESEAPASFDELVGNPIVQGALQGTLVADLCAADPYEKMMKGVKTATYAGTESLEGKKTHHLKFTQDQFDVEIWVAAEGAPTIRRVAFDLTKGLAKTRIGKQLQNQLNNQKMELIHDFKDWRIDEKLDDKTFAFQPPQGVQKTDNLFEGLAGGGGGGEASELLGKPAPDVSLKRLEEGQFRLKDHRDARIVLLDFWATWCGPCVEELPVLAEVAAEYKDKGVVFCAVNMQEKPEDVRAFLKEHKLPIQVAMDSDGEVATAYHAQAIPMLVLVDKKGVVQSVHVGYNPSMKTMLHKELDALLAGKDLAKQALERSKTNRPLRIEPEKP